MTPGVANEVCDRFHSIMKVHNMDSVIVDGTVINMVGLLEGRLSCVMIRQQNTLVLVYMPRLSTQFIFDCYGT